MCATSSSSAGLTCQLSRSPDLDQERRAHCLLSCLLGRFFTLDLNWQRRTWQLPFAWLPRTLAGLFLLFGSLRWELRLLKKQLKEYLSYTVGQFFGIASLPIVVVRNQKWVKSKAVIMGWFLSIMFILLTDGWLKSFCHLHFSMTITRPSIDKFLSRPHLEAALTRHLGGGNWCLKDKMPLPHLISTYSDRTQMRTIVAPPWWVMRFQLSMQPWQRFPSIWADSW